MSNFFSYITVEAELKKDKIDTFEKILEFVKNDFKKRLTEEEIMKTMSTNVKLGNNFFIKIIPLALKNAIVRLGYLEIRKYTTITFSNIGRIGIIGKYQDYIDYFLMLIAPEPVERIKCSACTFGNKMTFTFTSILQDSKIEKRFYEFLKEQGIPVEIESNGLIGKSRGWLKIGHFVLFRTLPDIQWTQKIYKKIWQKVLTSAKNGYNIYKN